MFFALTRARTPWRAARATAAATLLGLVALAPAGCARVPGGAPRRVVEREETIGGIPVRLRSELMPARATLGDRVTWRLTARLSRAAEPGVIGLTPPAPALELDASAPPTLRTETSGRIWSRQYVVRGFDLGAIALPSAALPVRTGTRRDTIEFPRDTLYVDSLTPAATGILRPDRGPINPALRPIDYAVAAIAALLAAAGAAIAVRAFLISRGRRREASEISPAEPPESVLARELEALGRELATLPRDRFYERLARSLRAYAAAVTGAPALDLTTRELERELTVRPGVAASGRERLIVALNRADLAKFARFKDEESEVRSILREAAAISGALLAAVEIEPAVRSGSGA